MADSSRGKASTDSADLALALLLFAITALYWSSLPRFLGPPDEPHMLFEAKRLLNGEVMYRDMFDLITPGWMYLMAALFHVFGTTLTTARVAGAVIQGGIALLAFFICRQLGIRRGLAWACGFAAVAVCHEIYPVASQHWLASLLCLALLALCLQEPLPNAAVGAVVGLLIGVHQQRGISMGLGVAAFVGLEALFRRRFPGRFAPTTLARQLSAIGAGALMIVVPLLAFLVFSAGVEPVWRHLFLVPLLNYHSANSVRWGFAWGKSHDIFTIAHLLKHLPIALTASISTLLILCVRGRELPRLRHLTALTTLCLSLILSITYYPDIFHIAFIASGFFIAIAEAVESGLCRLPHRIGQRLGYALALAIVLGGGLQLHQFRTRLEARSTVPYLSAFGHIDLPGKQIKDLQDQLDQILRTVPSRVLYCHPMSGYQYLLSGAQNPTRFNFVAPPVYTDSHQMQEIIAALTRERVQYVLFQQHRINPHDAVARYIHQHYEKVSAPGPIGFVLWRRKADADLPSERPRSN